MYLLYADGSGNSAIKQDRVHNGLYVLSCAIIHETRLRTVENNIAALKRNALPQIDPENWELHAHEIWNSGGYFARADVSMDLPKKTAIFDKVVNTICKSDIALITVVVFKDRIKSRRLASNISGAAWKIAAERFDHFLERAPERTNMGMIFMDRSDRTSESEIRNAVNAATRKGPSGQTEHVVSEPVFVRSDEHLSVQLADMVAYIVKRHYGGDSKFKEWFEAIMTKTYSPPKRARYGIKEFPSEG